ncbi:hypothetical protein CEXT_603891 [Caerostris extrusa]|uniref:Uncharacterized protein n=1 Tax=Caerostris extrusa TaxID=172846 RepID=A0AAV4STT8_CAEEX|nr:hypothetical protein CEXT_603891 [Caerostris extrusa]
MDHPFNFDLHGKILMSILHSLSNLSKGFSVLIQCIYIEAVGSSSLARFLKRSSSFEPNTQSIWLFCKIIGYNVSRDSSLDSFLMLMLEAVIGLQVLNNSKITLA